MEVQLALKGEKEFDTEFRIIRSDGEIRWLKANAIIIKNEKGEPVRMTGINYDITERKKSEHLIRESEERYRLLAENANELILMHDLEGNIEYINEYGMQITKLSREDMCKTNVSVFISQDNDMERMELTEKIEQKEINRHTSFLEFKDIENNMHYLEMKASPIIKDNQVKSILLIGHDVTELKKNSKLLKLNEKKLRMRKCNSRSIYYCR